MKRRHESAFRDAVFSQAHLQGIVWSGGDIKHYFLELLLLVVASGGGFGGVALGVGLLDIPCT